MFRIPLMLRILYLNITNSAHMQEVYIEQCAIHWATFKLLSTHLHFNLGTVSRSMHKDLISNFTFYYMQLKKTLPLSMERIWSPLALRREAKWFLTLCKF